MQLGNINEHNKWYQLDHPLEKCRHISMDQWSTAQGFPSWLRTQLVSPSAVCMNHFWPWAPCCVHTKGVSCRLCQPSYQVTRRWHTGIWLKSHGAHAAELRDENSFPEPWFSSIWKLSRLPPEQGWEHRAWHHSRWAFLEPSLVLLMGNLNVPGTHICSSSVRHHKRVGSRWREYKSTSCSLNCFHMCLSPPRSWLRQSMRKC